MQTKKKIIIKGRVHDVGYRLHLLQKAEELLIPEIGAWNIYEDGKEAVRVLAGGDDNKVKEFLHFIRESFPEEANVEGTPIVEDYEGDIPTIEAFSRSFSTSQLTKIATVGVGMLKKQDQMLDKQDRTINEIKTVGNKVDSVGNKVDSVGNKVDSVGSKVDSVGNKVDSLREETRQDFNRMDTKYDKMSEKMDNIDKTLNRLVDVLSSQKSK